MKKFICRKSHLCKQTEFGCDHKKVHENNQDTSCEFSYCIQLGKNVSCKEVKEEIKEEVEK